MSWIDHTVTLPTWQLAYLTLLALGSTAALIGQWWWCWRTHCGVEVTADQFTAWDERPPEPARDTRSRAAS